MLRPDPLPLDRVRRAGAAEAEELPRHRLLPRGDAARRRVRRAHRRRLRRQGEGGRACAAGRADRRLRHDRGRDGDPARVRADLDRREGDPAPEDAPRRDLRRADLGHRAGRDGRRLAGRGGSFVRRRRGRGGGDPGGRHPRRRARRETRPRSTRSSTRSIPRRATPSSSGSRTPRWRSRAARST